MKNVFSASQLSKSQLSLWAGQQLDKTAPLYNMAFFITIAQQINPEVLAQAWSTTIIPVDTLRTVYKIDGGQPNMVIAPTTDDQFPFLDFSLKDDPLQAAKDWAQVDCETPFALEKPLFRIQLFKLDTDRFVFYFNQHHLITDASSKTKLVEVLFQTYDALIAGENNVVSPLLPFTGYLKHIDTGTSSDLAKSYWKSYTTTIPLQPRLLNRKNPENNSLSPRTRINLGQERSEQLRQLANSTDFRSWGQDLSLFTFFLSTLSIQIARLSDQQKFALGVPVHNRNNDVLRNTSGLLIELFPLVTEAKAGESFVELYKRTLGSVLTFLRNAKPDTSDPESGRLFNVVINYINVAVKQTDQSYLHTEWMHSNHVDPGHHYRLQVYDFNGDGTIELGFDLNETIFGHLPVNTISNQFISVLDDVLANPSTQINELGKSIDTETDQKVLTTSLAFDPFVSKFDRQTQSTPAAIAVRSATQRIDYAALSIHADQLAAYLKQQGVTKGDRIALLLPRSPQYLISVLASLKSGAVFVPIPTNYPSGRILGILEDADPKMVISLSALLAALPKKLANSLALDEEAAMINMVSIEGSEIAATSVSPEDPAYIMYTSGSTGQPKGVVISHAALSLYLEYGLETYGNQQPVNAALFTSIGFDLTITSTFLPLISGGKVVVFREAESGPDLSLYQVIEDQEVDFIKLTPAHIALLDEREITERKVRTIVVGGELFHTRQAVSLKNIFGKKVRIYNEYGPTEVTVGCIVHQFDPEQDATLAAVPIGLPLPFVRTKVLDLDMNPVLPGVVGELYLSGPTLANEYFRQPELTTAAFLPLDAEKGQKFYRSGDLVSFDPIKGYFNYHGRKDKQVKIGGRRVELAEIEQNMYTLDGVGKALVLLRNNKRANDQAVIHNCAKCGLPSNYPGVAFNDHNVCSLCTSFEAYQQKISAYFKTMVDLRKTLGEPGAHDGEYDCLLLLSGGKDSSYALAKLQEMGYRILTFTLDNGYISEEAKDNVRRLAKAWNVDHVFGRTEAMNAIFVDSLQRHQNVCDGCFKTIYTLSVELALEKNIPFIITGLSRGQFFETRLTEELFNRENVDVEEIDKIILDARKAYHQVDDAVKQHLDTSMFDDERTFERVQFLDFYRYTDVSLDEMLHYLTTVAGWERPSDTGRSTNCLINQAGIYVHKKELGYSNYAFPYSWDVRVGHKTRDASLEEINEVIDEEEANRMLNEIGYNDSKKVDEERPLLVAYYQADTDIETERFKQQLRLQLPEYMVPVQYIRVPEFPMTTNGKIDQDALPSPDSIRPVLESEYVPPTNEFEEIIAQTWSDVLQIDRIGTQDNYLAIGGDSLSGIRIISRLRETFELDLPVTLLFELPTVAQLAAHLEATILSLMDDSQQ